MATSSDLRNQAAVHRKIADNLEEAAKALAGLENGSVGGLSIPREALHATRSVDLASYSGVDAIEMVLLQAGQPLSKPDILKRLTTGGKAIGANTLGAYLSREPRFVSCGRGRWGTSAILP